MAGTSSGERLCTATACCLTSTDHTRLSPCLLHAPPPCSISATMLRPQHAAPSGGGKRGGKGGGGGGDSEDEAISSDDE